MTKILANINSKSGHQLFLHARLSGEKTEFVTRDDFLLQIGQLVFDKDYEAKKHKHVLNVRRIPYTAEVLMVQSGRLQYFIWDYDHVEKLLIKGIATKGDVLILCKVAHSFRSLKKTIIIEIKQGPYLGKRDKIYGKK